MRSRILVFAFLCAPLFVFGQTVPTVETALELQIRPTNPRPGDTVTVEAQNISDDDSVVYVWRVNGSVVDQGRGVTGVTFTAGSSGSATVVSVSASTDQGFVGEKTVTVRPSIVDVVWEGNTYTPPLYVGRPLATGSSSITLQAVPEIFQQGVRLAPTNLVYRWYINHSQAPVVSGYGEQSISINTPFFANPFTVSVLVTTPDGTIESSGFVTIQPFDPEIVVYENAPLLGTRFDQAIMTQFVLVEEEVTLEAFPLYVQTPRDLTYLWTLDSTAVEEVQKETPRMVTFRRQGAGSGRFTVGFSMKSLNRLFEKATTQFQLTF